MLYCSIRIVSANSADEACKKLINGDILDNNELSNVVLPLTHDLYSLLHKEHDAIL